MNWSRLGMLSLSDFPKCLKHTYIIAQHSKFSLYYYLWQYYVYTLNKHIAMLIYFVNVHFKKCQYWLDSELPKYDFGSTLEDFGYHFNESKSSSSGNSWLFWIVLFITLASW